jgi:hypothetical protein
LTHNPYKKYIHTEKENMSKQSSKVLRILLLALGLVILPPFGGDGDAAIEKNGADDRGWQIFPRIGVGIEYGGFVAEDDAFTSKLRRRLEIDALQYNHIIAYLQFDEETSFGIPSDKWEFNRIIYHLNMGGLRYDFGKYYLGFFFNHWCFNDYKTKNYSQYNGRITGSVYFFGLEFLTKTMRLGMKDRGIVFDPEKPFEFLGRLSYSTAVSKTIDKTGGYDLDWLLRAKIRYDIFRYHRLIPYLEAGTELRIGQSARFNPIAEVGVRYHLRDKFDLTPFFQGGHAQEIVCDSYLSPPLRHVARNFLFGGLRAEALLDFSLIPEASGEGLQLLPEIHGNATYTIFVLTCNKL